VIAMANGTGVPWLDVPELPLLDQPFDPPE
jgi:hypothetical protein